MVDPVMSDTKALAFPTDLDREVLMQRLDAVLDPEIDESILKLGFVNSMQTDAGHVTVELHLPTYWCAPNFCYMMAEDTRRELLKVNSVTDVTIRLKDHFASQAIEAGVNSDRTFTEAFPGEALEDLDEMRCVFLRKGYLSRQEHLLRSFMQLGLSFAEISQLRNQDLTIQGEFCWVRRPAGEVSRVGPAELAARYFERREEMGHGSEPSAVLVTDLEDQVIPQDRLEEYFVNARTVRLSLEANGSLCQAMLQARKGVGERVFVNLSPSIHREREL